VIRRSLVTAAALTGAAAVPAPAAPPEIEQLVVFRNGEHLQETVSTRRTKVQASGRRCRVPRATPLAGLVRSQLPRLRVRDFSGGSCDPSSLFVKRIGRNRNRGESGWVYKVGERQGTTAASDPSGPFGDGRLKRGERITWFYCVFADGGCQRTLAFKGRDQGGGRIEVRVRGYDDEGNDILVEGATVVSGHIRAVTNSRGAAVLDLGVGTHKLYAGKDGFVRSFDETVILR